MQSDREILWSETGCSHEWVEIESINSHSVGYECPSTCSF